MQEKGVEGGCNLCYQIVISMCITIHVVGGSKPAYVELALVFNLYFFNFLFSIFKTKFFMDFFL